MKKLLLLSLISLSISLVSCQKEEVVIKKESNNSEVVMTGPKVQSVKYDE